MNTYIVVYSYVMENKTPITLEDGQEFSPKDNWPNLIRIHNRAPTPTGYRIDIDNDREFVPDWGKIKLMEEALDYVDAGRSYREVADWLSTELGDSVSHQSVANWWKKKRRDVPGNVRAKAQRARARHTSPKTPKEKAEHAVKLKLAAAKRSQTVQEKKLETFKDPEPAPRLVDGSDFVATDYIEEEYDPLEGKEIIFEPNPGPQTSFLAASEQEVLYGGAAGGGKSFALLADPLRYFGNPNFNGIIFRRTNDELRDLKFQAQALYKKAYPGTQWREKDSTFVFPSGSRLWFTYLERDQDVLRYQGQAFTYVGFDELTQYPTPFAFDYMRSRLRDSSNTLPLFMRATTNPGGPGHGWVKRMFIDPAPAGEAFDARNIETGEVLLWPDKDMTGKPHPKAGTPLFQRRFIPAKLSDNKYLYEDGQYEANLHSLNDDKRRQLLEGDWNVADGAAFSEFREHFHVAAPFEIPSDWRRFRSADFGYSTYSCVLWFAVDPSMDTLIVYRELYVSKHTGEDLAAKVLELERGERIDYGMLDSSVWHQRGHNGPSIAEEMIAMGCKWRPADRGAGSRISGKNRLHELLKIDDYTGIPGLVIFNNCRQLISDLPVIPADPNGGEDIDVRYASDHSYDALRYGIMSRPRASSPFEFSAVQRNNSYRPSDKRFGY